MYAAHLCSRYSKNALRKLQVAYNNIFRVLMGIKCRESASLAFVSANVEGFKPLMRKCAYRFYKRVMESSNILVNAIVTSSHFVYSSRIFNEWMCLLSGGNS